MNCDTLAMMCVLYPDFVKSTVNTCASCITAEGETNSQVIFYKEGFTYDVVKNDFEQFNTVLVTNVNKAAYFNTYLNAIKKDKVEVEKLNALIFDQFKHGYYVSGEKAGQAWNAGKDLMK